MNTHVISKTIYRPVAISNSLSKVFELILLDRCEEYLWTSGNQFGFKADHSKNLLIIIAVGLPMST